MVRAKFVRKKPHVNVGTIGHVDHGKTTLTAAISTVLACIEILVYGNQTKVVDRKSYDEIDSAPEEKAQGITIWDYSNQLDYVKNIIIDSVGQIDSAILVVSRYDGPTAELKEYFLLAKQVGVSNIVVFINKSDIVDDEELLDLVEIEIRETLNRYEYLGEEIPVVAGSVLKALEVCQLLEFGDLYDLETFHKNKWIVQILQLIVLVDEWIPS